MGADQDVEVVARASSSSEYRMKVGGTAKRHRIQLRHVNPGNVDVARTESFCRYGRGWCSAAIELNAGALVKGAFRCGRS